MPFSATSTFSQATPVTDCSSRPMASDTVSTPAARRAARVSMTRMARFTGAETSIFSAAVVQRSGAYQT